MNSSKSRCLLGERISYLNFYLKHRKFHKKSLCSLLWKHTNLSLELSEPTHEYRISSPVSKRAVLRIFKLQTFNFPITIRRDGCCCKSSIIIYLLLWWFYQKTRSCSNWAALNRCFSSNPLKFCLIIASCWIIKFPCLCLIKQVLKSKYFNHWKMLAVLWAVNGRNFSWPNAWTLEWICQDLIYNISSF
jgi:hypothetical protein